MAMRAGPALGLGLFFGLLVGSFLTYIFSAQDMSSPMQDYPAKQAAATPPANAGGQGGAQGGGKPGDGTHGGDEAPGGRAQASIAKVHFMKKFLAALSKLPENKHPAGGWAPLMAEGAQALQCADCHDSGSLDMERMKTLDPGAEAVDRYRKDPSFMIPLMQKWVARLNERHGGRLREKVTCKSCHAVDPREKFGVYPPLMISFVKALREQPKNASPKKNWKPLLKDVKSDSLLCGVCHGRTGERMEEYFVANPAPRPKEYADDKDFMIQLMEEWVGKLNRDASHLLTKTVVCLDCHETDPRR